MTVTVVVCRPSATIPLDAESVRLEFAALGGKSGVEGATNPTVVESPLRLAGELAETVFVPAVEETKVNVETPDEFVEGTVDRVFPVPPETEKLKAWLGIKLLKASRRVAVRRLAVARSAATPEEGDAVSELFPTLGEPGTKLTEPDTPTTVVSEIVFDSAFVLLIVVVATPLAFVVRVVPPSVFALPEAPRFTDVFGIRFP